MAKIPQSPVPQQQGSQKPSAPTQMGDANKPAPQAGMPTIRDWASI